MISHGRIIYARPFHVWGATLGAVLPTWTPGGPLPSAKTLRWVDLRSYLASRALIIRFLTLIQAWLVGLAKVFVLP